MQRMMITLLIAFAVGIVLGKAMLPVLHKLKFGQNIYELAPEAHKKKQGTPTMGGLVIAGAAIVAALIMNDYSQPLWQNMLLAMLVMALGNLCIGFVDDMTKIRRGKNGGLTPKQKMFFQTLLALAFSCYCYFHPQVGHVIQVPFFRVEWDLGIWYIPIMMFIIVGTTNSANLLDGLDGLLTSVSMVDFATLAVLCGAASLGSLGVGCAAMCPQRIPGTDVHGRHRLDVHRRRGGCRGNAAAPAADSGADRVLDADEQPVGYHPDYVFQKDARQAYLQDGADSSSL